MGSVGIVVRNEIASCWPETMTCRCAQYLVSISDDEEIQISSEGLEEDMRAECVIDVEW